jgi:peptidoglycan/LPS O-acetylase OafA/YrhL
MTTTEGTPRDVGALPTRAERRRALRGEREPKAGPQPRLRELDLLRLLAAVAVVLFHYTARDNPAWGGQDPLTVFPALSEYTRYGFLGVELFFMISGFVILMTAWRKRVGEFAIARVTRLFPAYLFAVVFTAIVVSAFGALDYDVEPLQVLTNLTMLQGGLGVSDVDGVYWSLWVELRFYLLVALLVLYGVTYRTVVGFMVLWLSATVLLTAAPVAFLDVFLFPRWSHYFIAGMALYLIHRFGGNVVLWVVVFVTWVIALTKAADEAAGAESIVNGNIDPNVLIAAVTVMYAVMIVVALGGLRWMTWRGLTALGLLTYPLYLLHEWVGWIMIDRLREFLTNEQTLVAVTAAMVALSYVVARFVEAPASARMRSSLNRALHQIRNEPQTAQR